MGTGVAAGVIASLLSPTNIGYDLNIALGVFIFTFFLGRYVLYKGLAKELVIKVYTTGLPVYAGSFLVTLMILFTLSSASA